MTRWAIDYRTKPNDPPTVTLDTGQPRVSAHSGGIPEGIVYNDGTTGALVIPGYVEPGAIYEFADTTLLDSAVPEHVTSVELTFDFWNVLGSETGAAVALGMFPTAGVEQPPQSPAHLVLVDNGTWQLSAFVNGVEIPLDGGAWPVTFNTEHTAKIVVDRQAATATLTLPGVAEPVVVVNPLVAGPARAGFWEAIVTDSDQHAPRIFEVEAFSAPDAGPASRVSSVLCSPWATAADLTDEQAELAPADVWASWLMVASEVLYALSGRRYRGAGCRAEFTYDADPSRGCLWWTRRRFCSHGAYSRIRLPEQATSVEEVLLDGEVLDPAGYHLTGPWLMRVGSAGWPAHGGRVVVTYAHGTAPPESGKRAAIELAEQLLLGALGSDACRLPERVTSISRQGITMTALDPMDFLTEGRTGLYTVDLFLAAENPGGRSKVPSSVWSPQVAARGRRRSLEG